MHSKIIRNEFLKFFKSHDHGVKKSASIVPQNDPTILFTAAGMVPFKDHFLGLTPPPHHSLASSQKCVRAGGKHNDFENVGYTKRHHTFFEMLGNFSFGKYFKEEAIYYAWSFLVDVMGLNASKLSATYFHTDEESLKLWKKFLPESKIYPISTDDNFWSMGDVGPCGPCTELFYDFSHMMKNPEKASEEDRIVEIWNLVFMQFNSDKSGQMLPLAVNCVDTGLGLERLACVMQGVDDNYRTDIFMALKNGMSELAKTAITPQNEVAFNVIADHIRCATFLIADGIFPDNAGRGYVLRKILRRAMRYAYKMNQKEPILHRLCDVVVEQMGGCFHEIASHQSLIEETILNEENRFGEILQKGMSFFANSVDDLSGKSFPPHVVFELYDTYGFPIDLTYELLRNNDFEVNKKEVDALMDAQKEKSKKNWRGSGDASEDTLWKKLSASLPPTQFVGYEQKESEGKIVSIVRNGQETGSLACGEEAWVIVDKTPFYAESGGQVGDLGSIFSANGEFEVFDTQKFAKSIFAHRGVLKSGFFGKQDAVQMHVSHTRRLNAQAHHTATHLLHQALRLHFSDSVVQKGSLVADDHLRFDFHLTKPLTPSDVEAVENWVNEKILENHSVECKEYPLEKARTMGAIGLFGEKYGSIVRVVSIGADNIVSREFCGGCHVSHTGSIGTFRILSTHGIGSDTRRIIAAVGMSYLSHAREDARLLSSLQKKLGVARGDLMSKVEHILLDLKKKSSHQAHVSSPVCQESIASLTLIFQHATNIEMGDLRKKVDQSLALKKNVVVCFSSYNEESKKISVILAVSRDVEKDFPANAFVQKMSGYISDKPNGGGRANFAQCGGVRQKGIPDMLDFLRSEITKCFT
ncbi:MAG: alanine--tRNA ligase [Alphaproteobacteria bacterium]|nr:alanine--tRNA ligase [Alphaproteobacteria bacterium]